MSWFICQNIKDHDSSKMFVDYKKIDVLNYSFYFKTNNRFKDDKLFLEDESYVLIIDGVLLNKTELYEEYKIDNMHSLMLCLYDEYKETFINRLRGPFSGVVYDKLQDKLIVFSNQTGDTHVFYYDQEDMLLISTDFNLIVEQLNDNNKEYALCVNAVKQMLTFGYLIDKDTFIEEIKRLQPGNLLLSDSNTIIEKGYHRFKNDSPIDITLEESIELVDKGFKRALKRCFEKDIEYGYNNHLVDMSGGLDSRMVAWIAKSLGYKNSMNISYSQSMTNEQEYASEVASVLGNEFIHKQLDDLKFLYDPEEILMKNFGLASYEGITGGNELLKSLNFNNYGLEHTGQLGDVVIGSYVSNSEQTPVDITKKRISNHIKDLGVNFKKYSNQEMYILYTRGMQGVLSTHCTRRNYTEAVSPFIDVDFLKVCLDIPLKYRANHKLYFAWIEKKYPEALRIKTTRQSSVTKLDRTMIFIKLVYHRLNYEFKLRLYKKGIIKEFKAPYNNMNPYRYWYATDSSLRVFMQAYYDEEIDLVKNGKIKQIIQESFNGDKIQEKLAVITVLGMHKIYFNCSNNSD